MSKINYQGYIIDPKDITQDDLIKLKDDLTIKFDDDKKDEKTFVLYQMTTSGKYIVPRYYGVKHFNIPDHISLRINKLDTIDIKFNGQLRDYQEKIIKITLTSLCNDIKKPFDSLTIRETLKPFGGGLISIPPGKGKTVIGIYLATLLKFKTLVIVHKNFLVEQWKERIQGYTNAKIGIIQQDKIDIADKDIVIGMLQSISMKTYDNELFKSFPLVIFDECHHLGAKVFSKALRKIQSPYLIGLSATPERKDGLEHVFMNYLGDILYKESLKPNDKVIAQFYDFDIKHAKYKAIFNRFRKEFQIPTMVSNIVEIDERNKYISSIINKTLDLEPSRKILILSGRREHCETLIHNYKQQNKYEDNMGLYVGGMKKAQLKISEEKQLIFGTYEMAQEALDIPDLDTLVLSTPLKGDIIQTIGRILRKQVADYINPPKIIDIVDNISCFKNQAKSRYSYYESNNYQVEFFTFDDNWDSKQIDYQFITPSNKYKKKEEQKDLFDDDN
jgi:superfamily II DNA or RNA helicase